jgi:hypothetical protein
MIRPFSGAGAYTTLDRSRQLPGGLTSAGILINPAAVLATSLVFLFSEIRRENRFLVLHHCFFRLMDHRLAEQCARVDHITATTR